MTNLRSLLDGEELESQLARVRRFVVFDVMAAVGGMLLLSFIYARWRPAWVVPILLAVIACLAVLLLALRQLAERRLAAAVVAVSSSFFVIPIVMTIIAPITMAGIALITIWPVLLSVPYVDRTTLRNLVVVTVPAAVGATAFALRSDPYDVTDTLSTTFLNIGVVVISLVMVSLTLVMIWAYSGRLEDTVRGLIDANAALLESERSLEAKVAERTSELAETSAYLEEVIDNLAQGLVTVDDEGRIDQVNPAFARMFGLDSVDGIRQADYTDVLPGELVTLVPQALTQSGDGATGHVPLADDRTGKAVASTIREEPGGPPIGTVVLIDDVTVERDVDRMKTDFISTVSHELRTPLTSVLGFARIIQKRLDEKVFPHVDVSAKGTERAIRQVDENLDIILSEGERLTTLINEVLDIAKMEARQIDWHFEDCRVAGIVDTAVNATRALYDEKGLPLRLDLADDLPSVSADEQRVVQVVINLLSNAQKFTDDGHVTVRAVSSGDLIEVSIADTGAGVAAADLDSMFDKFSQVGDAQTDRPAGTGLGLPICREIVQAHGGEIWATSELGSGTTVTFTIPALAPSVAEPLAAPADGLDDEGVLDSVRQELEARGHGSRSSAGRILVVDDDEGIRRLLRDLFETAGYEVHEAVDGPSARAAAERLRPDLITLDVLMPGQSGIELAVELRGRPATSNIPLVVVSVLDRLDHDVAIDAHVTKPIDADALLDRVAGLIGAPSPIGPSVLIVDGSPTVVGLVVDALERAGFSRATPAPSVDLDDLSTDRPSLIIANAELSAGRRPTDIARFERHDDVVAVVTFAIDDAAEEDGP